MVEDGLFWYIVIEYCTTLIFGGNLIWAILAVRTKSSKIYVCQYLVFNTLTYVQLYRDSDKKENLMSTSDVFSTVQ